MPSPSAVRITADCFSKEYAPVLLPVVLRLIPLALKVFATSLSRLYDETGHRYHRGLRDPGVRTENLPQNQGTPRRLPGTTSQYFKEIRYINPASRSAIPRSQYDDQDDTRSQDCEVGVPVSR